MRQYLCFCTSKASKAPYSLIWRRAARALIAPAQLLRCQYLYWCTGKASKLSTNTCCRAHCCSSGVSICTGVLVKQVNWAPDAALTGATGDAVHTILLPAYSSQYSYFCTSKARKLGTSCLAHWSSGRRSPHYLTSSILLFIFEHQAQAKDKLARFVVVFRGPAWLASRLRECVALSIVSICTFVPVAQSTLRTHLCGIY